MKLFSVVVSVKQQALYKINLAGVFLASMIENPMFCYMFDGISSHENYLFAFEKALVLYSLVNGEVYSSKELNAAECWLFSG